MFDWFLFLMNLFAFINNKKYYYINNDDVCGGYVYEKQWNSDKHIFCFGGQNRRGDYNES